MNGMGRMLGLHQVFEVFGEMAWQRALKHVDILQSGIKHVEIPSITTPRPHTHTHCHQRERKRERGREEGRKKCRKERKKGGREGERREKYKV